MASINIPVAKFAKNIVVDVELTGVKVWTVRLWFMCLCFKFGAWIGGIGIDLNIKDQ